LQQALGNIRKLKTENEQLAMNLPEFAELEQTDREPVVQIKSQESKEAWIMNST
jgi:hypothetical protein